MRKCQKFVKSSCRPRFSQRNKIFENIPLCVDAELVLGSQRFHRGQNLGCNQTCFNNIEQRDVRDAVFHPLFSFGNVVLTIKVMLGHNCHLKMMGGQFRFFECVLANKKAFLFLTHKMDPKNSQFPLGTL